MAQKVSASKKRIKKDGKKKGTAVRKKRKK